MTFSNYINTPEDNEFLSQFPIPNENDSEWIKTEKDLSCQDCIFYNGEAVIFPCAVNPEKIYKTNECDDYSIGEENDRPKQSY